MAQVFSVRDDLRATKDAAEVFGAMGVMRDMPLQKYVHDALICLHTGDGNPTTSCASPRRWSAIAGAPPRCWRRNRWNEPWTSHLSDEQRDWQMTARKFAEEEIRPISLERDEAPDAHDTFDWDIVKKGSKLGFRTLAVPKE